MVRLEALLDSWKSIRHDTSQAVEDFPAAGLDFKSTEKLMTFCEIARHIPIAASGLAVHHASRLAKQAAH
jgi:hypothetical protein